MLCRPGSESGSLDHDGGVLPYCLSKMWPYLLKHVTAADPHAPSMPLQE